jgi:Putative polyhydroxyalkanoic acid system protein (PHA_gran_rgn)
MKVSGAGTGSNVTIEVDLPLMLTPIKGMVQATLEKKLQKALA